MIDLTNKILTKESVDRSGCQWKPIMVKIHNNKKEWESMGFVFFKIVYKKKLISNSDQYILLNYFY